MQASLKAGAILLRWLAPVVLIASGVLYIVFAQDAQAASSSLITSAPAQNRAPKDGSAQQKVPVHLTVENLAINLGVKQGSFDVRAHQWEIDDTNAFFAKESVTPLIYGHNRPSVFQNLHSANARSELVLNYADGTTAHFTYVASRLVNPGDVSILSENDPYMVMLLTCSGVFSDSRRIVYFEEQK